MTESGLSGTEDWFSFCDNVRSVNIRTRYFLEPKNDPDFWIATTSQYFNYLGLTLEQAETFLNNLLIKAQEGRRIDGVNGSSWQDSLSEDEQTLARLLHFENHYTNWGIELYVTTCQKSLTQ